MSNINHDINDIIQYMGGRSSMADALDVAPKTIYVWVHKNYIPPLQAIKLERLDKNGVLKAAEMVVE